MTDQPSLDSYDLVAMFEYAVDVHEAVMDICFRPVSGLPLWIADPAVRLLSARPVRQGEPPICIYSHPTEGIHGFLVSTRGDTGRPSWIQAPFPFDWEQKLQRRREIAERARRRSREERQGYI